MPHESIAKLIASYQCDMLTANAIVTDDSEGRYVHKVCSLLLSLFGIFPLALQSTLLFNKNLVQLAEAINSVTVTMNSIHVHLRDKYSRWLKSRGKCQEESECS